MSSKTRIIGYIVLGITEAIIGLTFWLCPTDRAAMVSAQVIVFCTVWGAVGLKNYVDVKRDVAATQEVKPYLRGAVAGQLQGRARGSSRISGTGVPDPRHEPFHRARTLRPY